MVGQGSEATPSKETSVASRSGMTAKPSGVSHSSYLMLAGGRTDSLVLDAAKVVQEDEVVGLLQVGLLVGTLEHFEGVREGSGEGRRPEVDRETMT